MSGSDESICISPPPAAESYLNPVAILAAATISNAEAIHRIRLLSKRRLRRDGRGAGDHLHVAGAHPHDGRQDNSEEGLQHAGIPVVPGSDGPVANEDEARAVAETVGFPSWSRQPPAVADAA